MIEAAKSGQLPQGMKLPGGLGGGGFRGCRAFPVRAVSAGFRDCRAFQVRRNKYFRRKNMQADDKNGFLLAEYKALRDEILLHSKARTMAVLYTIAANASILAFIASDAFQKSQFSKFIFIIGWIPLLLTIAGYFYYYESAKNISRIARYIKKLERHFVEPEAKPEAELEFGWEHNLDDKERKIFRARYVYHPIFILQIVFSVLVGLIVSGVITMQL